MALVIFPEAFHHRLRPLRRGLRLELQRLEVGSGQSSGRDPRLQRARRGRRVKREPKKPWKITTLNGKTMENHHL